MFRNLILPAVVPSRYSRWSHRIRRLLTTRSTRRSWPRSSSSASGCWSASSSPPGGARVRGPARASCHGAPAPPAGAVRSAMATDTTPATGTGRTGITRPVLLAGIVLGTCLTILVMWNGVRLRVPDIPSILGAALGALIVWALFMAAAADPVRADRPAPPGGARARLAARQARRGRRRRVVPACSPGRGRQVTSMAYADRHGDADQVGRTWRACRAGAGRPGRGQ